MENPHKLNVKRPDACSRTECGNEAYDFIWPIKFGNTLPDVPFEAKFLPIPQDLSRYVSYKITDLERSFKYDVITDKDPPALIDLVTLNSPLGDQKSNEEVNDIDLQLLEDDIAGRMDPRRSVQHGRLIPWLRKTEYMCSTAGKFKRWSENRGKKFNQKLRDIVGETSQYESRESQLTAIEKRFSEVKSVPRKHPYNAGVFAVEELPIFPDFEDWKLAYTEVIFDSDQSTKQESGKQNGDIHKYALIRGMMDENDEQFVAYLLPTEKTLQRLKANDLQADDRRSKDKRFEYEFSRQYNWHLRSKASADYEANYCLTIRNGCAYYNELDTSVHLNRCASNKQNNNLLNFRVMVSFRQPNDQEIAAKEARMRVLQLLSDEKIKLEQEEDRRNAEENRLVEESKATYVLENYDVGYEDKLQKNDEKIEPTDGVSDGHSRNEQEDCPKPSCSWE